LQHQWLALWLPVFFMPWYDTVKQLSEADRKKGLHFMTIDGLCSHAMMLLVTGAFLPGIAVALNSSNFVIGLLGSLAPMSQMVQIPAIWIVEKIGLRKLVTVVFAMMSRVTLVLAALVPFIDIANRSYLFFGLMLVFFIFGAIAGCSWNSWIKDIVPGETLGAYFSQRLSRATQLGLILTIIAAFGIDGLTAVIGSPERSYGIIFLVAAIIGIIGAKSLAHVPEPQMTRITNDNWLKLLTEPLKDKNFRRLLAFSASWSFTVIMSAVFMAVYMLERIGLSMATVVMLGALSQVTNIFFFRIWGNVADHYSNKSVLRVSVPMFILVILLYPFTTMPEKYFLSIPLLVLIHILGGISTAGFNLCAANIAIKLAPEGNATSYLATNAFCSGITAAIAPIFGGIIGSFFAVREISIKFFYNPDIILDDKVFSVPALSFRGLDFIFFAAALSGLYAIHRLSLVEEAGTVSEKEVRDHVYQSMRTTLGNAYGLSAGMRRIPSFPLELLRKTKGVAFYRSVRKSSGQPKQTGLNQVEHQSSEDPDKE
jgi:MFS family permease